MNGSSALNLINSRISRFFKIACVAISAITVVVGSFSLPAAAADIYIPEDTSDWKDLALDPYLYYMDTVFDKSFHRIYSKIDDPSDTNANSAFSLRLNHDEPLLVLASTELPVYQDSTYTLSFTFMGVCALSDYTFSELSFSSKEPNILDDVLFSNSSSFLYKFNCNSNGVPYEDLVFVEPRVNANNGRFFGFDISFSTAPGYIDNLPTDTLFINNLWNVYSVDHVYTFSVTLVHGTCLYDPGADYFHELTKDRQNKLVDLTKNTVSQIKDSLSQVTVLDDMSAAVDQVSDTIGKAFSLVSPVATYAGEGGVNIYPAFALFTNIYNSVMGSVDPTLLALAATVPLLCFLAWLFSSLFKSIL